MGLVHARIRCPLLALEPAPRLGHRPACHRLERVLDCLRSRNSVTVTSGECGYISPRLGRRRGFSQRQPVLRYRVAAWSAVRRAPVLFTLFFSWAGPARALRPLRGLLGAKPRTRAD